MFSFSLCPYFSSVSVVSSTRVCFELGSVWSLSVQTDVLYMPFESNHSLFLSRPSRGEFLLRDPQQRDRLEDCGTARIRYGTAILGVSNADQWGTDLVMKI